jgi:hypothetical protein
MDYICTENSPALLFYLCVPRRFINQVINSNVIIYNECEKLILVSSWNVVNPEDPECHHAWPPYPKLHSYLTIKLFLYYYLVYFSY